MLEAAQEMLYSYSSEKHLDIGTVTPEILVSRIKKTRDLTAVIGLELLLREARPDLLDSNNPVAKEISRRVNAAIGFGQGTYARTGAGNSNHRVLVVANLSSEMRHQLEQTLNGRVKFALPKELATELGSAASENNPYKQVIVDGNTRLPAQLADWMDGGVLQVRGAMNNNIDPAKLYQQGVFVLQEHGESGPAKDARFLQQAQMVAHYASLRFQFPKGNELKGKKVVVAGAGPVGLTTALQLLLAGAQVTVADAGPDRRVNPGGREHTEHASHAGGAARQLSYNEAAAPGKLSRVAHYVSRDPVLALGALGLMQEAQDRSSVLGDEATNTDWATHTFISSSIGRAGTDAWINDIEPRLRQILGEKFEPFLVQSPEGVVHFLGPDEAPGVIGEFRAAGELKEVLTGKKLEKFLNKYPLYRDFMTPGAVVVLGKGAGVDLQALRRNLLRAVGTLGGEIMPNTRVTAVNEQPGGVRVQTTDGLNVSADYYAGALLIRPG